MKLILNKVTFFILSTLLTVTVWAQNDSGKVKVDINVDKGSTQWYQQAWVWIAGAAVFILLLVALLRGGGRKEE